MKLEYKKDICGNDILQDETGKHQVMMAWEKPYMKKCIEILNPSGDVLEIGFGLGYSAREICKNPNVKSYTIVECSPVVWKKIEEFKKEFPDLTINLIKGRWQDVIDTCGVFDSCFFDDYSSLNQHENYNRANKFLFTFLKNHSNIGSNFVVYSDNEANWDDIAGIEWSCSAYDINIPENCNYVKKYQNKMYVCQVKRIGELDNDLKKKIFQLPRKKLEKIQEKIKKQVEKIQKYYKNQPIYCNLMIIDNFYTNALETRNYILTQEFKVRGNYPGQRTTSRASTDLKEIIEGYIQHFAGKIVDWRMPAEGDNNSAIYNGAFQYTTSRDRTWIHNDGWNNWAGVLYLTPNAPVNSGTGIYRFKDGTRNVDEAEARGNKKIIDENSQDYTKWELVDKVGNVFNRLVLFNSKQYHASMDYFGTNKENGRLFQVFFFSTER